MDRVDVMIEALNPRVSREFATALVTLPPETRAYWHVPHRNERLTTMLNDGLVWRNTPQGSEFWVTVHRYLIDMERAGAQAMELDFFPVDGAHPAEPPANEPMAVPEMQERQVHVDPIAARPHGLINMNARDIDVAARMFLSGKNKPLTKKKQAKDPEEIECKEI